MSTYFRTRQNDYKINLKDQIDEFIDSYVEQGLLTFEQLKGIETDKVNVSEDISVSSNFLNEIQKLKDLMFNTIVYCVDKDFVNYEKYRKELEGYCSSFEEQLFMTFESLEDGYKNWL